MGKIIAMIPARYDATRFPGKLMKPLGNSTVIRKVYENTVATRLFDEVSVVTDSDIIEAEILNAGGKVYRSQRAHESGSDRIAEIIEGMEVDIILNVQGDMPFVKRAPLENLLASFKDPNVQVGSLMQEMLDAEAVKNPNVVKVVVDKFNNSLLFSRSPIPYPRSTEPPVVWYEHVGVYAYRKAALMNFTSWAMTPLEAAEKIECLRYLENGIPLKMVVTEYLGVNIDTPEDLIRAAEFLQQTSDRC
ncbi:3-deoxy-manno-octulosonate cytidylyltransferase [Flavihumibacter sp. CACIAM 22H1]|uniref:3-deoxy-manno-octulosonate cytidylyltransferase n=1 Tax=Flavihumibacter sp. CACIAM 22H1 TaxID=1812911 RepID=UPI0007A7C6E4|nr:3-deoxy-manno-octulosonate cytidylyltransferase [Flavihumibacter sp. CACIAM 22H1]KYP15795.1 MAG: 3-deoxy-manno-octulosonate cytidylyltransferase [Flavihumibacter sp. CACIAM 22H1]